MGQLRKHLKRNIFHRIRYLYFKMKLEKCGNAIFFEKNVQFMRFPGNISCIKANIGDNDGNDVYLSKEFDFCKF